MKRSDWRWIPLMLGPLMLGTLQGGCAGDVPYETPTPIADTLPPPAPQQSPEQLEQMVAPIALYPDALVAQILAAATYPSQIVEADRWRQQHPDLKEDALAEAVNAQSWDSAVKALTQFPGLLGMMDQNLSWTSSLGEAYVNGQQDVLEAIQAMRQRAQQAGNLQSTPQESVTADGSTILIEPADPEVVYVPEYDPWLVYGDPLAFYPGWIGVPGFYLDGPGIEFGLGIGIGVFGGFGWGWHSWGTDWHGHGLTHGDHPYHSHSREFVDRRGFGGERAGTGHYEGFDDSARSARSASFQHADSSWVAHAAAPGLHSGAFSGFSHGGDTMRFSARGRSSFGGGFHGGGSFHGGAGRR